MKKLLLFAMLCSMSLFSFAQMTSSEDFKPKKQQYIVENNVTQFKLWFVDESNLCMFSQKHTAFCDPTFSAPSLGIYTDCLRTGGINYRDARGILTNLENITKKDWYKLECGSVIGRYANGDFFIIVKPSLCNFKNKIDVQNFMAILEILDTNQKRIENQ